VRQRAIEQHLIGYAAMPAHALEAIGHATREAARECLLVRLENVHREPLGAEQHIVHRGTEFNRDRHQRWFERDRCEGIGRHPHGMASAVECGDHRDAGGEATAELPEFERVHVYLSS
jgi:hypothetical protein